MPVPHTATIRTKPNQPTLTPGLPIGRLVTDVRCPRALRDPTHAPGSSWLRGVSAAQSPYAEGRRYDSDTSDRCGDTHGT